MELESTTHAQQYIIFFFAYDSLVFIKATERSARALVDIVSTYGGASGQSIYLAKSRVFFSKTTRQSHEQKLKKS